MKLSIKSPFMTMLRAKIGTIKTSWPGAPARAMDSVIKAELFSAAQMAHFGQKLARSHRLSPDKIPWYLLKRLDDNESVIAQNCFALQCRKEADQLRDNLNSAGWDGEWYRRGYFDTGEPLGSHLSQACQIDAIAQSWAVLSGAGTPEQCAKAMQSLDARLVDDNAGMIKLLTPPFNGDGPNPGYIQGYVPGVRENGGQYTHGAIWAVMAFAQMGNSERAWQLWSLINPINHSLDADAVARYKVEPWVMTADVYSVAPHTGRGGWSWYTGSAGWAYRLLVESLLGITRHADALAVRPLLPAHWPSVSLTYQHGSSEYHIQVVRSEGDYHITLDGADLTEDCIPLRDEGQHHHVTIHLGGEDQSGTR